MVLFFCLIFAGLPGISAQEGGTNDSSQITNTVQILEELQNDVLRIFIRARVLKSDQHVLWNIDIDELTIPGRGVNVRLNSDNMVADVEFIPFRQVDDTIMLIAQGQAWVEDNVHNKLSYKTSMKSIPVNTGESVFFYPLGVDPHNDERMNLELEIMVTQYRSVNTLQDDSKANE